MATPEPRTRTLPHHFGRYTLFDFIGKGGMAEIFLARAQTDFGGVRLAVIKQILPEFAGNAHFAEMLVHEAKLSADLNHGNVVQVFDLGREDDRLYIAMEYVEGFDLNALLRLCSKSQTRLPVEFALHVVADLLKGLDYAHRRTDEAGNRLGLVHCDVSPSNILLSVDGEVKVCDFGIARANVAVEPGDTSDEFLKGKAGYMSPEHARGEPIDARADVFAAGIVLWELLAGRRLYRTSEGGLSLLKLARTADIPTLPSRGLAEEAALTAVVARALSADREERYPTASAMLRDLEDYMMRAGLFASPLRFGEWMSEHFGDDIVERRRARERAALALERGGASVTLIAIDGATEPHLSHVRPPISSAILTKEPRDIEPKEEASRPKSRAFLVLVFVVIVVAAFALAFRSR